jgi:hypothetical protein
MVWLGLILAIVAPPPARAQFEALGLVAMPPVGAWAEYQVTRRNSSLRVVLRQRVALIARERVGDTEVYWFQIEMETDDFAAKRLPMVTQIALRAEDALKREDYFRKIQEMIVRVGGAEPFRLSRDLLAVGVQKNLLTGGQAGAGSDVRYTWRDLPAEPVKTAAGEFACRHKKGLGNAEVVLSYEEPTRYPVDAVLELWYRDEVPFGLVKSVTKQSGTGPQNEGLQLVIDTEETVELVACGTGAVSAITGPIVEWDPARLGALTPRASP